MPGFKRVLYKPSRNNSSLWVVRMPSTPYFDLPESISYDRTGFMVVYYHMNFANWKLVMFTGITEMYKRCVPETLIYKAASKSTPDCLNLMKVERQQAN